MKNRNRKSRGEVDGRYIFLGIVIVILVLVIINSFATQEDSKSQFEQGKAYAYERVIGYKKVAFTDLYGRENTRTVTPKYTISDYNGRTFAVIEGRTYWLDSLIFNPEGVLVSPGESIIEPGKQTK